jgi:site-specific DNA recombinase
VISARPAHPALVSEADFIAAQGISAARGPAPSAAPAAPCRRIYLLAGLLACGVCGRRMESAWSNGKPAYRCRHGHTSAASPDSSRPKNAYIREVRVPPQLPALYLLLTGAPEVTRARRRTRCGADVRSAASPCAVIGYLRVHHIVLTWDPAAGAVQARATGTAKAVTVEAS